MDDLEEIDEANFVTSSNDLDPDDVGHDDVTNGCWRQDLDDLEEPSNLRTKVSHIN